MTPNMFSFVKHLEDSAQTPHTDTTPPSFPLSCGTTGTEKLGKLGDYILSVMRISSTQLQQRVRQLPILSTITPQHSILRIFTAPHFRHHQQFSTVVSTPTVSTPSLSTTMVREQVPFPMKEIPLSGFPLGQQVKLSIQSESTLSTIQGDFLIVAVQAPVEPTTSSTTESTQSDEKKPKTLVTVNPTVDSITQGYLSDLITRFKLNGAEGKSAHVRLPKGLAFKEAGLLGLGSGLFDQSTILDGYDIKDNDAPKCLSPFAASKLGRPLASMTTSIHAKSVVLYTSSSALSPASLQSLVESYLIANCPDERFKSKAGDPCTLESFTVVIDGDVGPYASVMDKAKQVAAGVQLTRELIGAPPNFCNPETLAQAAVKTAQDYGLKYKVLGEKECVERKMGSYLAVNQGSMYEPQFIHLTYTPEEGEVKKRIVFIGKGVCMDTGGYNLKTLGGIESMKMDMGGAAAVFGSARIIGALRPKNVEVHFIVAAAENMIDRAAYRPGDVITASNGKTIEVLNTDGEGRLTLADALVYAENEIQADAILDCATLTGAILAGLGTDVAAVYSQDNQWMSTVLKGAKASGTALWPMPLFSDYKKNNESKCADIANLPTPRLGGSILGALFIREFVKETPWAHIDLAGPVWDPKNSVFTGYGAKLLAQIILDLDTSM